VVAAWLKAEAKSPQFAHCIPLQDSDRHIIERPNLDDPAANSRRFRLLFSYREGILRYISGIAEWYQAELSGDDLAGLFAGPYPSWEIYSGCTGRVVRVAEAIRHGVLPRVLDENIHRGLATIQKHVTGTYDSMMRGEAVDPLILLENGKEGGLTVIEGTKRATALCWCHILDGVPCAGVAAFIGITQRANPWVSPHATP